MPLRHGAQTQSHHFGHVRSLTKQRAPTITAKHTAFIWTGEILFHQLTALRKRKPFRLNWRISGKGYALSSLALIAVTDSDFDNVFLILVFHLLAEAASLNHKFLTHP